MRQYIPLFGLAMWLVTMMLLRALSGWAARRTERIEREAALTAAPESHPESAE